jgi:hypothetical protein
MTACKPSVPSQYIQPGDMEDLLYDYHIAQAIANEDSKNEGSRDYDKTLYFAAVLEKHGVTKAEFDSSLVYYYTRADRFNEIYKNVADRLGDEAMKLGASENEVNRFNYSSESSDTMNIWTGRVSAMLVPYPPYNRIDFVQKADTSFRKGDSFMFIINDEFIYQSGSRMAEACLALTYDNDTVISRTLSLMTSGLNQMRIPENPNHQVKEIRGYIFVTPEREETSVLKLMAIRDIQLIKFRSKTQHEAVEPKDSLAPKPIP